MRQDIKEHIAALDAQYPEIYEHLAAAMRDSDRQELWPPSPARSCCKNSTPSGDVAKSRLSNENKGLSLHHYCCYLLGFNRAFRQNTGSTRLQLHANSCPAVRLAAAICVTLPLLRSGSAALRIRLRDLWLFAGTGICSLVFFNYCYFNAMQQTSLAVAALLLYTAPVFVMLMSLVCFGEAFTRTKALALLLTFSGCACVTGVFGSSVTLTLSGLLYGLGSGFGYALYSIFGKYAVLQIFVTHHHRLHLLSGTRSFMAVGGF